MNNPSEKALQHKQKLLKRYAGQVLNNNQEKMSTKLDYKTSIGGSVKNKHLLSLNNANSNMKMMLNDNDNVNSNWDFGVGANIPNQGDSQSQSSSIQQPINRKRIDSSDDEEQEDKQAKKQMIIRKAKEKALKLRQAQNQQISSVLKSKKIRKKFKKAFGIQNDEEIDDFFREMKVEGMTIKQVKKLLKSSKVNIKMQGDVEQQETLKQKQSKKAKKEKKKLKKQKNEKQQNSVKFQGMLPSSESSDIQIPEQARTIYRNKDGTIKLQTDAEIKQKKQKQIKDRLAQWEKGGMQKQDSDKDDNDDLSHAKQNNIWDDPLKLWNQQTIVKPFQCRFQGPANRFGIKPGHRWDGVIRGNNFENQILKQQNQKKATQARADREYLKNL